MQAAGSGSSDSEHHHHPKKRRILLRDDDEPPRAIDLSTMSRAERRELEIKLRSDLAVIRDLLRKLDGMENKPDPDLPRGPRHGFGSDTRPGPPPPRRASAPGRHGQSLMKQCETLLKQLMKHSHGWVFKEPVDPVKLHIPSYFSVIKNPMDLGTISTRLDSGYYSSPRDFAADVRLTFHNALTFNAPGDKVYKMADTMSRFFETKWRAISKRLLAVESDAKTAKKRRAPPARRESSLFLDGAREKREAPSVDMRGIVYRQLESFTGDLPETVLDLLDRANGHGRVAKEDEIEFDLDNFSDEIVIELRELLNDHMRRQQYGSREVEILKAPERGYSSGNPCKGNEPADEDVDIVGNEDADISSSSSSKRVSGGAGEEDDDDDSTSSSSSGSSVP